MPSSMVVITGASRGLGLSLSKKFVARGDSVFGITKTRKHWKTAQKIVDAPSRFHLFQADLTSGSQVKQILLKIYKKAGRVDVLINNAGYGGRLKRLDEETLREFQQHLSVNLFSVFLVCKYALPYFKKQRRGWIVNISSMAGKRAVPLLSAYSASKFGVVALSQCLAKENPDAGFTSISVCPGGINTQMRTELFGEEDARKQQSPDFVADKIIDAIDGKISVRSGGDIVIRHSQVTVNPPPEA